MTITDTELAQQVNAYLEEHQYATRCRLRRQFHTSDQRLQRLLEQGLIVRLPLKLTPSQSATLASKNSDWRKFKLPGSVRD